MKSEENLRILLIDDHPTDLAATLDALRKRGWASGVRTARGGQEALDYLFGHGDFANRRRHPLPALILLDLNMPSVDGHAVLCRLKQDESLRRIPVIVLCLSELEGLRAVACSSRPSDFLVKPVTADCFCDLAQQVCNWTLRLDRPEPYRDALR
jgi:two-component system response regulator